MENRLIKSCEVCGTPFTPRNGQKLCSDPCRAHRRRESMRQYNNRPETRKYHREYYKLYNDREEIKEHRKAKREYHKVIVEASFNELNYKNY